MSVNVEEMSREQLENAVIQQAQMLRWQSQKINGLEKALEESEEHCDKLGNIVLQARRVLSC